MWAVHWVMISVEISKLYSLSTPAMTWTVHTALQGCALPLVSLNSSGWSSSPRVPLLDPSAVLTVMVLAL